MEYNPDSATTVDEYGKILHLNGNYHQLVIINHV